VPAARHHLTILVPDGAVRDRIEPERSRWDPAMAAGVPAHVSLVYPEEVADFDGLLARAERATREQVGFPLDVRGLLRTDEPNGVFVGVGVTDRTGAVPALRAALLPPGSTPRGVPLHVTIVHPRTSNRGEAAFAARRGAEALAAGSFPVTEVCWTETSAAGMEVRARFPLRPSRVQQVAAVLRRGDRVLLCHRTPDRRSFPDCWDLPGGHVEVDEHGAVALARELREELGITVTALPDVPARSVSDDEFGIDLSVWVVDEWDGEPVNTAPEEHDDLAWCDAAAWSSRRLAHPAYPALLADAVS
jgi:8-oxo-dGTP pyrophosphatase MutT (NUDIX family)